MKQYTHYEDTREEAEAAKALFTEPQYSTGPIVHDPVHDVYTFTIKEWSLD